MLTGIEGTEKIVIELTRDLTQDWGVEPEGGITGDTRLAADLQFASVDIIQLCVAIEQHFGRKIGFQNLLMKDGSYVPDISLSQMAQFVAERVRGNA